MILVDCLDVNLHPFRHALFDVGFLSFHDEKLGLDTGQSTLATVVVAVLKTDTS